MGLDGLVGIDGFVAEGDVDVPVACDDLGDMRWQTGHDGIGDEYSSEVVWGEVQRATGGWISQGAVGESGVEYVADGTWTDSAGLGAESALE